MTLDIIHYVLKIIKGFPDIFDRVVVHALLKERLESTIQYVNEFYPKQRIDFEVVLMSNMFPFNMLYNMVHLEFKESCFVCH